MGFTKDAIAAWRCHQSDTVAVAMRDLSQGETIRVAGQTCVLRDAIPVGHKFALRDHPDRGPVTRYGETIGLATCPIAAGAHVHSHNLATALGATTSFGEMAEPDAKRPQELGGWQG